MSIDAKCPGCRATFAVPDRLDGKRIRCKTCGEEFRVGGNRPAAVVAPDFPFPPLKPPRAFGRPDQPTDGVVVATLSNPRRGREIAGEPTYQVDFQWQGASPQASDQLHLYVKAQGAMADTFL